MEVTLAEHAINQAADLLATVLRVGYLQLQQMSISKVYDYTECPGKTRKFKVLFRRGGPTQGCEKVVNDESCVPRQLMLFNCKEVVKRTRPMNLDD